MDSYNQSHLGKFFEVFKVVLKYIQTNDFYYIDIFQFAEYWNSISKKNLYWNSIGRCEQKQSNVNNDNGLQMLTMRKHDSLIENKSTSSDIHTD